MDDKNHMLAILERFEDLAILLQSGDDISGDKAGALLAMAVAGARREIEGGE